MSEVQVLLQVLISRSLVRVQEEAQIRCDGKLVHPRREIISTSRKDEGVGVSKSRTDVTHCQLM